MPFALYASVLLSVAGKLTPITAGRDSQHVATVSSGAPGPNGRAISQDGIALSFDEAFFDFHAEMSGGLFDVGQDFVAAIQKAVPPSGISLG
jgi:hypothetical protein